MPASSLTATGTTLTEGIRLSDPASGKTWSLGDSMMITIVRADINLGKVDFEVAPETQYRIKKRKRSPSLEGERFFCWTKPLRRFAPAPLVGEPLA